MLCCAVLRSARRAQPLFEQLVALERPNGLGLDTFGIGIRALMRTAHFSCTTTEGANSRALALELYRADPMSDIALPAGMARQAGAMSASLGVRCLFQAAMGTVSRTTNRLSGRPRCYRGAQPSPARPRQASVRRGWHACGAHSSGRDTSRPRRSRAGAAVQSGRRRNVCREIKWLPNFPLPDDGSRDRLSGFGSLARR